MNKQVIEKAAKAIYAKFEKAQEETGAALKQIVGKDLA